MSNTIVKKKESEVVAQDANILDMSMFVADAGVGNKEVDQDSLSIPFLKTNLTKQIRALHKGSSEGDVINTVTNSIYNGENGFKVIPCAYQRRFIQWSPQGDDNSAPIAIYTNKEACPTTERSKEDNKEYLTDGSGQYIEDTHQHFVLVLNDDGSTDVGMIAMKSTSLKKSKKWNSIIAGRKMTGPNGQIFSPPRFGYVYHLWTYLEEKSGYSWYNWEMKLEGQVEQRAHYDEAKLFALSVEKGDVKVKHEQEGGTSSAPADLGVSDDKIPF
jgi:hypothetical protein